MSYLYAMRSSALMLICVLFYLLSAGQTIHACFTTMQRGAALRRLGIAYEVALVVHLVLACAVANSAMENQGVFILWLHPVVLPVVPLLWANAVAAVMGGIRAVRLHRWSALAEVALLACCTPVAIGAMGQGSQALLAVDASYFAARVAATLAFDLHDSKTSVSRLSILHRYLEDGREDPQTLEKVTGLLSSIVDDLAEPSRPAASAGLASICDAFSLVGVEVRVTGELPADEAVACAFAEIVLEAVTNAAKHAQAAHVDVRLGGGGHGEASLVVTNDGGVPDAIVEGTGIPGMRQMATAVGATFFVSVGPPFAVEVTLPPRDVTGNSSERILPETQNERGHQ